MCNQDLVIQSHRGEYQVCFRSDLSDQIAELSNKSFFVIDRKVWDLYPQLRENISEDKVLFIIAQEESKKLSHFTSYVEELVDKGVKRNNTLVAIGGGIIQDITCFIATILFRGLDWQLIPTTLLAQADSCIGSKSSINVGKYKNLIGTFVPPKVIYSSPLFLFTLSDDDIKSGIGEIIKVHIIAGKERFMALSSDFKNVKKGTVVLEKYIRDSLIIKRGIIEIDEFDKGTRNRMNYGHSFGHAIESATNFAVPHGIAVTIGMDFANFYSYKIGRISKDDYECYSSVLTMNADGYTKINMSYDDFLSAIKRDKKNVEGKLAVILPIKSGGVEKVLIEADDLLQSVFESYFFGEKR